MVISIVALIAVSGYLLGRTFTESQRTHRQVDRIRQPICAVMYTALSHPPTTPAQAETRGDLLEAYGPTGLKCPKPLPVMLENENMEPK
jgi:hypothetical protein